MALDLLHPLTLRWFQEKFSAPTEPQRLGWPAIAAGRDTLIAAPTGSGKTLAAFLFGLDRLLRAALADDLQDRTYVLYVSPLRALSNDIQRNLQAPLAELLDLACEAGRVCPEIRAQVRTGDTTSQERQRMLRRPPHILVTTPESLYLVLTAERSRQLLRQVETVIVDEIHALARDKRGSHLALSLERLEALCTRRPQRIGLSATQKPIEEIARFLTGVRTGAEPPQIVDTGHIRTLDLAVEVPQTPLEAVCSHEQWAEIYERLVSLIREHRSTLVFVNTRRHAERVARQLSERLGEEHVASHHGSLAHAMRQRTEHRLKHGELRAVVATASLELGIDIGHIDLVCQLGTPRSIATLLQRIGRAGHALGVVPKGRLFALTRDELLECLALVRAIRAGRLDRIEIPRCPLDILAQQIAASVACDEWDEGELYELCRRAYPFRELSRPDYECVVELLSEGMAQRRGRRDAFLHRDRVNGRLRPRRGARLTAITCGGAIPETADYRVVTDDEARTVVGTVHEDFAIESMAGDIFLLGNTSWKIRHMRGGEVVVQNAHGAPPTIPFWLGEAPGRTAELSAEVSELRGEIATRAASGFAVTWLEEACSVSSHGARQAVDYVAAQQAATGFIPSQKKVLFERFFDESGGMQLVIHAPYGTRINRAWGLALRKRFCRTFNFELQASAGDNGIVLSLGPQHSFPLEQMFSLVNSTIAREILEQALLAVPYFTTRWRWNVTRALAVKRVEGGRRVPPPLQRFRADDLMSAVFPMQTACLENVVGDIEVPDHPLVRQTMDDCLHEATDLNGWVRLLEDIEQGTVELVGLDTREPSPFSHELLNSNPYAFLDDAPLEERRARAVQLRRTLPASAMDDLGRLDPEAIAQVRSQAWPLVRDADELHDTLLSLGVLPADEGQPWREYFDELRSTGRAVEVLPANTAPYWASTERWPLVHTLWPEATARPEPQVPAGVRRDWQREEAVVELVRGRLECVGPITAAALAETLRLTTGDVLQALVHLENQGFVLRGRFTGESSQLVSSVQGSGNEESLEWCERRLLARIHRLTLEGLRRQIEPVAAEQFLGFLFRHQHLHPETRMRSQSGLLEVLRQLQGFEAAAGDWENHLLPSRVHDYDPAWLDLLTLTGQVSWGRLRPTQRPEDRARPMKSLTRSLPLAFLPREDMPWLLPPREENTSLSSNAQAVLEILGQRGALFAGQLAALVQMVPVQMGDVLGELAAAGLITCDGFGALRALIATAKRKHSRRRSGGRIGASSLESGRWSLLGNAKESACDPAARAEHWCRLLLRRYGVMFRDLMGRESAAPPWQDLVRAFRRLEARGDIRGGRFVAGVAGEQYALSEVIPALRQKDNAESRALLLAGTDPLNLWGRITTGVKVPAAPGCRLIVAQGQLVAHRAGREVRYGVQTVGFEMRAAVDHLLRRDRPLPALPVH